MAAGVAMWVSAASSAQAAGLTVDIVPNFIGTAVGSTTEWMGSKDRIVGIVPGGRVKFSTHRFAELYGPIADVNILNVPNWEFGPMISYRFGREDVEDPIVNRLPGISGGLEVGAFAGYHHINTSGLPWRLRVGISALGGVAGGATGGHITPYASFWMPLSQIIFVGFGSGFSWSSESFMQQRFGVSSAASGSSGLPVFSANSGVRQVYAWPAVLIRLSEHWFGGAGAFYQRLTGDAADSPIVTQRGDPNQWTAGIAVGYAWK
jgi:outer membrane protein